MASTTTVTAAKALEILGKSVVSAAINGFGHLIFTRDNGSTIDAGDFTSIVTSIMDDAVEAQVAAQAPALIATSVANKVSGTVFAKGNQTGAFSFSGITADTLVNASITATLTGNITVAVANLPASPKPGTQFVIRMKQDATGGRTLTLTGFKKSQGVLTLTVTANAVDLVSFYFDGTDWYAGAMGLNFS
jgi:hypothetical protein